jgi:heat shock protein HslJ
MVAAVVVATSCAVDSSPTVDANPLAGTAWLVSSIDGQPPVAGRTPLVRFDEDTVTGSGGCNDFDGRYSLDGDRLIVVSIGTTADTCSDQKAQDLEDELLKTLREDPRFIALDDALTLVGTSSEIVIRLVPAD